MIFWVVGYGGTAPSSSLTFLDVAWAMRCLTLLGGLATLGPSPRIWARGAPGTRALPRVAVRSPSSATCS
jgi:hypothetical protein